MTILITTMKNVISFIDFLQQRKNVTTDFDGIWNIFQNY